MSEEVERLIATMRATLRERLDYPWHLMGLAETVSARGDQYRAAELAREAMVLEGAGPAAMMRGRRLLSSLLPGYHVPMMNDPRRNFAWDAALRRAIRPDMLVLEIGTGAGMLALMAARAGATVVTCEMNPIAAQMAREIAARNGLGDRIAVVTGPSQRLDPATLGRPADMLICDIFGDELLDFDPLSAIADARARLLAPDATAMPMAASICGGIAEWHDHPRVGRIDTACGFDLTPFADFVPAVLSRPVDIAGLRLLSLGQPLLRFDFCKRSFPRAGKSEVSCQIETAGEANTIARWIRLELDAETTLEARPDPGAAFFSGITLAPLADAFAVAPGETVTIGTAHDRRTVTTWIAPCAG